MRLHNPSRPDITARTRGFTLVELLVVIGIIALLISILLPTLGRVRQSSQTTACLSNLRQIGIAYRLYAESNRDLMPYILNRSWNSYIRDNAGNNTSRRLYWYMALARYLDRNYDPMDPNSDARLPQIFKACPAWTNWVDPEETRFEWATGYGQNLYMFAGFWAGANGVGPRKVPLGTRKVTSDFAGNAFGPNVNIDGQNEANADNPAIDSYAIGLIQLSRIPRPSNRIIAGDSSQYWMALNNDLGTGVVPLVGIERRLDFTRAAQVSWANATDHPNIIASGWESGHPNRHGGDVTNARPNLRQAGKARANYLFADGHATTLEYSDARRLMQAAP
jgi:prepilin-type N-terminal cleavage/methylation domain-containing protein/prepilin-type processing-associated H-X9-DG protein